MGRFIRLTGRVRRHKIIRKRIEGTQERPRLSIYRSLNHLYAQVINDLDGKTLVSVSTNSPAIKESLEKGGAKVPGAGNVKCAAVLGAAVADLCKKSGITKVVFDRSGYLYHGRVKALADAARKGGLQF